MKHKIVGFRSQRRKKIQKLIQNQHSLVTEWSSDPHRQNEIIGTSFDKKLLRNARFESKSRNKVKFVRCHVIA